MRRDSFINRDTEKGPPAYRHSKKQEKSLASRLKGSLVPGSGSGLVKGDVRVQGVIRVEAKATSYRSFSVTLDMIDKIESAAASGGELPVIAIDFIGEDGKVIKQVCVCPSYVLDALVDRDG